METIDGEAIEQLVTLAKLSPVTLETRWSDLQLAHFCRYAMSTYLNPLFLFAIPAVETKEIEPWQENGETWRP